MHFWGPFDHRQYAAAHSERDCTLNLTIPKALYLQPLKLARQSLKKKKKWSQPIPTSCKIKRQQCTKENIYLQGAQQETQRTALQK